MSEETILTRRVMLAFAVLACIFLCMACASANENVTCGDDNVTECAVLASADNGSGSFEELSGLVSDAPDNATLVLEKDYEYVNGSNKGVLVSKPITIDGAGHTLNGNGLSRMFNVTADTVILRNINFVNGNAYGRYFSNDAGGGAIYWNGANGYIENCSFTNNAGSGVEDDPFDKEETWIDENGMEVHTIRMRPVGAKINEGGAIVWNGTNGTVSKCIFTGNHVGYPDYGGAICWRGSSGKVLESEFYRNSAWAGVSMPSARVWIPMPWISSKVSRAL